MTFTYDLTSDTDLVKVRYHLGDTVEADAIWSDEDIAFAIALNNDSWQKATVSLIQQLIVTMARTPNFRADWLQVDTESSIKAWKTVLSEKRSEFGLSALRGRSLHVYRADSREFESPDYSESNDSTL